MKNQQDYIHFGSSTPIVLAPYETVPIGGSPTIQVMDPDLYIRVRDILLARQLSGRPGTGSQTPLSWPGPPSEPSDEVPVPEEAQDSSTVVEGVETSELRKYVDEMLVALPGNDLVGASATLVRVIACL